MGRIVGRDREEDRSQGVTAVILCQNEDISTTKSLMTGKFGSGSMSILP